MEEENAKPSWRTELQDEIQKVFDDAKLTQAARKKKLIKWAIRQVLTMALVYWLWDKPWINYVLWIWIPLAILNLGMIFFYNDILRWRMRKFDKRPPS